VYYPIFNDDLKNRSRASPGMVLRGNFKEETNARQGAGAFPDTGIEPA